MYRAISRLKKENQHEIPNFPLHLFLINKFSKDRIFLFLFLREASVKEDRDLIICAQGKLNFVGKSGKKILLNRKINASHENLYVFLSSLFL